MALTCPHCGVLNRCDCKNCNPEEDPKDLVIIDYANECYQCYSCSQKFSEGESLDYEWDKMHEHIKNSITPEMCLTWRTLEGQEKKKYEKENSYGSYGFESAFFQHFGVRYNQCSFEHLMRLKSQVLRDKKINSIL